MKVRSALSATAGLLVIYLIG